MEVDVEAARATLRSEVKEVSNAYYVANYRADWDAKLAREGEAIIKLEQRIEEINCFSI